MKTFAALGLVALVSLTAAPAQAQLLPHKDLSLAIAATIGRFVLLGGVLALASLQGAAPLLAMALGILIARSAVIGRVREAAP